MPDRTTLERCSIIQLPRIGDSRGDLTVIEGSSHVPFDIKRIYYLYGVPPGQVRGAHAHKNLRQVIIAISGSFDVVLDDGYARKRFHLNKPYLGLYVCPMMWREIESFSPGAVCAVLASDPYDEEDYYRDYNAFLRAVKGRR